ncbi:polygalacturonase [Phtheirospermum japonicum]|uniref:Polygalacturonase n=1 Tax=Phtheirospermum japonicum TaxID=374723 RepID=A0A830BD07_9LAMI|nr:polygalacturonase [Phtheirospermum japonicum]
MIQFLIFTFFFFNYSFADNPSYNVQDFGAHPNGRSDCTESFLQAWQAACSTTTRATVYVPQGVYKLKQTIFDGDKCENEDITFRIDGTLVAPSNYEVIGHKFSWLQFQDVTGLTIDGGTLYGQGQSLWSCKKFGKSCPIGATSLGIYNSQHVNISGLSSFNSQLFHIIIFGCQHVELIGTKISAHGKSPNTDGIHISQSSDVTILDSEISTGDDCISIGPASSYVWIEKLSCGPGHGVSIGSLGWSSDEEGVYNVTVKTATFTGTTNGVRIKTWSRDTNSYVTGVLFQHLEMDDAQNPIIIDQNYCPGNEGCPHQGSGVKISDITYQDVHGTSASQVAVNLACSKKEHCDGIKLDGVKLTYNNQQAMASCSNAYVTQSDETLPKCSQY